MRPDVGVDEMRRVDESEDEKEPEAALAGHLGLDAELRKDGATGQRLKNGGNLKSNWGANVRNRTTRTLKTKLINRTPLFFLRHIDFW